MPGLHLVNQMLAGDDSGPSVVDVAGMSNERVISWVEITCRVVWKIVPVGVDVDDEQEVVRRLRVSEDDKEMERIGILRRT